MLIEDRCKKLNSLITCMKCEVSGKVCNDDCSIQYEAGNMGEIIENLEAIYKELSKIVILEDATKICKSFERCIYKCPFLR